jgi:hypothetical protein
MRSYDENHKDHRALTSIFNKLGDRAKSNLPASYGIVNTDKGPALETDLIRDEDGSISISFKEYLYSFGYDKQCERAITRLKKFILSAPIPIRDLFPHNISMRRAIDGTMEAYIVDGLGMPNSFQFWLNLTSVSKLRNNKKFIRLLRSVDRTISNRANGIQPKRNGMLESSY